MPNHWGRIDDLDTVTAVCHSRHAPLLTTAFGPNPYSALRRQSSEPLDRQTKALPKQSRSKGRVVARRSSAEKRPSNPQEFLAQYKRRLEKQQVQKASKSPVQRLQSEAKAAVLDAAKAMAFDGGRPPGGGVTGPIAGTSWATWAGKVVRQPQKPEEPKEVPPKSEEVSFLEAATMANCAPAILALPEERPGIWPGGAVGRPSQRRSSSRPTSAANSTSAEPEDHRLPRARSASCVRQTEAPQRSGSRPSSAAPQGPDIRPSSAVASQRSVTPTALRPYSASEQRRQRSAKTTPLARPMSATVLSSKAKPTAAAGGKPGQGPHQELVGSIILEHPGYARISWQPARTDDGQVSSCPSFADE